MKDFQRQYSGLEKAYVYFSFCLFMSLSTYISNMHYFKPDFKTTSNSFIYLEFLKKFTLN